MIEIISLLCQLTRGVKMIGNIRQDKRMEASFDSFNYSSFLFSAEL